MTPEEAMRVEALKTADSRGLLSQRQSLAVQELTRRMGNGIPSAGGQMGRTQRYDRQPWTLGRGLNVANLSTFGMPVVNDIAGFLDDSYMYLTQPESRTWGNAAMSAAGLLPFVPSAGGIIAGRGAQTLKPETVEMAEKMRDAGASRNEIWRATGETTGQPAFFDERGQLKFEIDDSSARLSEYAEARLKGDDRRYIGWQEEGFDHQGLYESYPGMKDVDLIAYNDPARSNGYHSPKMPGDQYTFGRSEEIGINADPSEMRSINLHELQHGVQGREGYALGGSPKDFEQQVSGYKQSMQAYGAADVLSDLQKQSPTKNISKTKLKDAYQSFFDEPLSDDIASQVMAMPDVDFWAQRMDANTARIPKGVNPIKPEPLQMYKRLAGEVESRAVQARLDMPMSDRIKKPFWESYDVPEDELIYRYE